MAIRVFREEDADAGALSGETVAVLGYGIQGRAQSLCLRDSGVEVVVGNREDSYREQALEDGFDVRSVADAVEASTIAAVLLPDEIQPEVYGREISPGLEPGKALVFAHGFAVHFGLVEPASGVDLLLLAPRMPGPFLRARFLQGSGIPAFVDVGNDATGRAWPRLLGLAHALGITRVGALQASFAQETELDLFSEHFTYPLMFRALEIAFETLVEAGYPEELALMELHGSEELGQVFLAAAREGITGMLAHHASPACQVGIAHHWERSLPEETRERAREVLENLREGSFARHLLSEAARGYPELSFWKSQRPSRLKEAEARLESLLERPRGG